MAIPYSYIDQKKWLKAFKDSLHATPFQSPEFFDFFISLPGQSAKAYAIEDAGEIKASCIVTIQKEIGIKAFFSNRAIIYGGFLFQNNNHLDQLIKKIQADLKGKAIYIETRNLIDYSACKNVFENNQWKYVPYLNFQINLQNETMDSLLAKMKYNRRREIGLSFKEGAECIEATELIEIRALYGILRKLYTERVKLPLPKLEYFEKLFLSPIGKVFIVKHANKIIGGSFCFYYPQKNIYTLYYCGEREYHKKIFPTHLAIYAAMDFGIKNNLKKLDLMGAGKPGEEYGVRNYKAEFGGEQVEYGRFIKIYNPLLYNVGKLGLKLIQKIKK